MPRTPSLKDLDRVRREKVAAETRMRRLLEMVEEGLMFPNDAIFAERLAQHGQKIAQLDSTERSLSLQLARALAGSTRIPSPSSTRRSASI